MKMTMMQNGNEKQSAELRQQAGVRRYIIKMSIMIPVYGAILFLSAGSLKWAEGWIFMVLFLFNQVLMTLILLKKRPDLLAERSGPQPGMKPWDKVIVPLAAVLFPLLTWLTASFDYRNQWTQTGIEIQIVGLGLMLAGVLLIDWAMFSNAFFSAVVRIQKDRDHKVVDSGPYRLVRHPGYVGAIASYIGIPLMLGSWWALIPAWIAIILFIVRTSLEDRTLQKELEGYAQYADRVRYRLIPGLW
jgi:protein-S-isoprenylcysteine O-methyltransferase Ste14